VFALGLVYLFFIWISPASWVIGIILCLAVYFLEIVIDNAFARVKWRLALQTSWVIIFIAGGVNLLMLSLFVK